MSMFSVSLLIVNEGVIVAETAGQTVSAAAGQIVHVSPLQLLLRLILLRG